MSDIELSTDSVSSFINNYRKGQVMSSLWDCEKCGYNHYESADKCKNCGTESNLPDMVNHPPHYKDASGIECIEVTKHMQFCGGNCFKYLYRAGKKGSTVEDLKKAVWYAERAWLGSEQICDEAIEKIGAIAKHRTGYIQDAMLELADENWLKAIDAIDRELGMLGGE